jgi:uncharacterized protein
MRLLFDKITRKTRRYTIAESDLFSHKDEGLSLLATANITVSKRDNETVQLKGQLIGERIGACGRCGEQVKENLQCEFDYLVTTREEEALQLGEIECSEEDAITLYLKEPEINIDEILREQAFLSIPLRTLCSIDCKGICAGCGVVLNSETCCCPSGNSDSPFAVLGKLNND